MSQWIVVDDSDSAIIYTADPATPWRAVNQNIPGIVDLDNAIFETGHVLSSNGSLSFSFTGTDIETCSIDNIAIPTNLSALDGFPWTSYCSQAGMTSGSHTLHVNVTATDSGSQFWFDYIRYVPFPVPSSFSENQTFLFQSFDPAIQYSSDWKSVETVQVTAEGEPGDMTFIFNGTGITWYSLTLQSIMQIGSLPGLGAFPQEAGSALITLDGVPLDITIPINISSDDPSYDMPLFECDGLDPATEHVLTATYQADTSGMSTPPLTLDFLLVQTGPDLSAGIKPSGASRTGTITGAVLGPLLFFFFFAILIGVRYWHRRQRTLRARALSALTDGAAGVEYRAWPQGAWREDSRQ